MAFAVRSLAFKHGGGIPAKYTCDGENVNPSFIFDDVPEGTASIALIMDDPDAETDPKGPGKTFDHWVLYNLMPDAEIEEHSVPAGAMQGKNGAGDTAYTGPCPPTGTHRYFVRAYALDTILDLPAGATKEQVMEAAAAHVLASAEVMATYSMDATDRSAREPATA